MLHEEDHCFQCQESGHIAHHCPKVHCFECNEYVHIVMDCQHRIPPSVHLHITTDHNLDINTPIGQLHATITMTDTDAVGLDHNPILTDTVATVPMIPTEAALGHTIGIADNITGVLHNAHTQALISTILSVTLHIEAHQPTHKIAADHAPNQPTSQLQKPCIRIHHIPEDPIVIHALKEIQE